MSASNREACISKTLSYEGGFTNNPHDPGGATNWGITIADARLHWKPDATIEDMRRMPRSVAVEIYRLKYWAKIKCDDRAVGPDLVDFDLSVNSGIGRVTKFRAVLDPMNLSPVAYVKQACAMRSSFLHALRTWKFFGAGWSKRVADVEATGVRMAIGAEGKPVAPELKKHADAAAKKAITHSTATAGSTVSLPAFHHHIDLTTVAGWVFFGVLTIGIAYFLWNAVQANHRANAYAAQLKG